MKKEQHIQAVTNVLKYAFLTLIVFGLIVSISNIGELGSLLN